MKVNIIHSKHLVILFEHGVSYTKTGRAKLQGHFQRRELEAIARLSPISYVKNAAPLDIWGLTSFVLLIHVIPHEIFRSCAVFAVAMSYK